MTLLVLAGLALLVSALLRGTDVALFMPKGLIAREQHSLMLFSVGLMLAIAIPTLVLFYFFAWRYRESNEKAAYDPHTSHGKFFVLTLWLIPSVIVFTLAHTMWPSTHKLDPHRSIVSDTKPLTIQVVALRWKWLFIYPEQSIATVNFVQVPIGTPIQFELTADETPMSSFWIPQLGGQLYAMTGHANRLNLMADTQGDYTGGSAEINGAGFAGMKFIARASSKEDFDLWVQKVQLSSNVLNTGEYEKLLKPSENNPANLYSVAQPDLYDTVLMKYSGSHRNHTEHE
ncbi:MAG TPA: ubiquinol oxidase subunit II [Candidatus Saccharimonadales bacterium]|nr:ubiquinol oxidase subunit II [Candidatus Saccharimonadales bacterium]